MSKPSKPGLPTNKPTADRKHASRRKSTSEFGPRTWRRFFSRKRVLLVLLGLFLIGAAVVGVAFAVTAVPQPNDLAKAQASIIYYADGKTEMARISEVNREIVPLSKIPVHVQHALLAAEDRTFYQNNGISPTGIGRALIVALKGGQTQGGSTITQQYVKNYFLTQDRTVSRKAKEFIISIKIDQSESKSTILANYLNTIYYGRGAYGIQTAAKAYFGKDVSKLTVAEGALLASVIRGPSYYDPGLGASQKANAIDRVKYVLDGMVSQGWLTPQARAKVTFPKTIPKVKISKGGTVGYLVSEVKRELETKLKLSPSEIDRGGLRIVSTIDKRSQDAAVLAVNKNMPPQYFKKAIKDPSCTKSNAECIADATLHVGLTAIKPGDGAIVAMYGGRDFVTESLNTSTQAASAQAGSTFKVFGLLAALQKGISTQTRYDGYSPQYFPQFADNTVDGRKSSPTYGQQKNPRGRVVNFDGEQSGRIDLSTALAHSVNTVFAQLNIELAKPGAQATGLRDAAVLAGLPKGCAAKPVQPCTAGLGTDITNIFGTASPHVLDMANAYATIAAQGQRATPYIIRSVTSDSRNYKVDKTLKTAFTKSVTADVTDAMTQVVKYGTASAKASSMGRPAAGKTGTTTDNTAAWFDGFTPQLATAVAMYQGDTPQTIKVVGKGQITGASFPLDVWKDFMVDALEGQQALDFPQRAGVGDNTLPPPPPPPSFQPAPTFTTAAPTPTLTTAAPPTPTFTRPPRPTRSPRPTGTPKPTKSSPPTPTVQP